MTKDQSIIQALKNARIPKEFQRAEASLEPYADRGVIGLQTFLTSPSLDLVDGATIIIGEKEDKIPISIPVTFLTARALVLRGIGARCHTLPFIAHCLETQPSEFIELLSDVRLLVVLGFCDPSISEASPYAPSLVQRMQWHFHNWLAEGRSLLVQTNMPSLNASKWWPKTLLAQITQQAIINVTL